MTPEFLLTLRLAVHLATVALLASYCQRDARFRLGPSVMAGLLLASSAGMAFQILTEWDALVAQGFQPHLLIFVFTVFIPIAWARGNVAKLYDGMVRIHPRTWWPWR